MKKKKKVHTGWLVGLTAMLLFFYGFLLGGQQLVMMDIAAEYQVGTKGMGGLISAQHVAAVIMPLCMGATADRVGKKRILVVFTFLFGMGCVFACLSGTIGMYLIGACLIGSGYSVCESVSAAVITDLDAKQGMRYINITQFLLSVGAISGPIVLQFCMKNLNTDWRFGFGICAAGFLIITVLLKGTEFPEKRENKAKEEDGCNLMSRVQKETIACFLISIILYVGLENGFGYFVNPLFTVQLKQAELGAIAISGYWMGMSASRLLCGFRNYNAERMLLVCFWVSGILFLLLAFTGLPWLSVGFSFLLGTAFGPIWSTLVALAAEVYPEKAAGVLGIMSAGSGMGGIVYPVLMGGLSERYSLSIAFVSLGATAFLELMLCFWRKSGKRTEAGLCGK